MSKTAAMIGAAAVLALAGAAQAQPGPDRDGLARMQGGQPGGRMMERMTERRAGPGLGAAALLRAADVNGDGVATRAEVDALLADEFAFRDRTGDGVIDTADLGPMAQRMAALRAARPEDPWARPGRRADGDRQVTRDEMMARTGELFTRLDTDGDGAITAAEARPAPAMRPGRRGDQDSQP